MEIIEQENANKKVLHHKIAELFSETQNMCGCLTKAIKVLKST